MGNQREGGVDAHCGVLISSLMDFVSGVSVRNHAFIIEVNTGGGIDSNVKQIAFILKVMS